MKRRHMLVFFAAALTLCVCLLRLPASGTQPSSSAAPAGARTVSPSAQAQHVYTLFPGLNADTITAITVSTPQQSFQFQRRGPDAVSVNGQQADSQIFLTLLEQIAELPVDRFPSFSPDTDKLLLTLVVYEDGAQHTARFYADGAQGEKAHIISGSTDAPQYRQTGGWRVGTLMMTCEGTRIQDAHGNETPAKE